MTWKSAILLLLEQGGIDPNKLVAGGNGVDLTDAYTFLEGCINDALDACKKDGSGPL